MSRYPSRSAAVRWHDYAIYHHGGAYGLRDVGLLESALAAPRQAATYSRADIAEQASVLAYALVNNHAFLDGNKRTAFVAMGVFLRRNGYRVRLGLEWADIIEGVATGAVTRRALENEIRAVMPRRIARARNPKNPCPAT